MALKATFETGKTYYDLDYENSCLILERTAKTVTIFDRRYNPASTETRKTKIFTDDNGEYFFPLGKYSGAVAIFAFKPAQTVTCSVPALTDFARAEDNEITRPSAENCARFVIGDICKWNRKTYSVIKKSAKFVSFRCDDGEIIRRKIEYSDEGEFVYLEHGMFQDECKLHAILHSDCTTSDNALTESSQPATVEVSQTAVVASTECETTALPEALYDDDSFSDYPGDNSCPDMDIPESHEPDSAPATDDHPGFTIVPSEHITRPDYAPHHDHINDECPYTVVYACDIPEHNPAAAVVPYDEVRRIRNFFHIIAIYIRLWLAMNIPSLGYPLDDFPDGLFSHYPARKSPRKKIHYAEFEVGSSYSATCFSHSHGLLSFTFLVTGRVVYSDTQDNSKSPQKDVLLYITCNSPTDHNFEGKSHIRIHREHGVEVYNYCRGKGLYGDDYTFTFRADKRDNVPYPFKDKTPFEPDYMPLGACTHFISRSFLDNHDTEPAVIPAKNVRHEAWQSHSCQYCENEPRPTWTHKQFALGIILSTEYSNYKTKTRYCTKSMSEWLRNKYNYSQLRKIAQYLDINVPSSPNDSIERSYRIISTRIADIINDMEHYYVCTYEVLNPPALPVELQHYFKSRAESLCPVIIPAAVKNTTTQPRKKDTAPASAPESEGKLIDTKDLHGDEWRKAHRHNISVITSCMFEEAVTALLLKVSTATIKQIGGQLGTLNRFSKGNKSQLIAQFVRKFFELRSIRNKQRTPSANTTANTALPKQPEGVKFVVLKNRQIGFIFSD